MEQYFRCPVCLDLAKNPREIMCCNQLFCLDCIQQVSRCPICRVEPFAYQVNKMVTRMMDSLPDVCPFECGASVTRGNLKDHIAICERSFVCGVSTCDQVTRTNRAQYLQHMVDQHADLVEGLLSQYFKNRERTGIAQSNSDINPWMNRLASPPLPRPPSSIFIGAASPTSSFSLGSPNFGPTSPFFGPTSPLPSLGFGSPSASVPASPTSFFGSGAALSSPTSPIPSLDSPTSPPPPVSRAVSASPLRRASLRRSSPLRHSSVPPRTRAPRLFASRAP